MAFRDEVDEAEHAYWREFCPGCGTSPCSLRPGETDAFHADLPVTFTVTSAVTGKSGLLTVDPAGLAPDCPHTLIPPDPR